MAVQATDDIMAHAHSCWVPKATNTHSKYVMLTASPLLKRLQELASLLRYMYIGGLVVAVIR
jgi:hypothetical protein